jgi:hypothetical protein
MAVADGVGKGSRAGEVGGRCENNGRAADRDSSQPLVSVALVMESASPSTSVSFASTGTATAVSSLVVAESFTATGASFTAVMVTVSTAESVPPFPSLIEIGDRGAAVEVRRGVKVTPVPLCATVPWPLVSVR